MNTTTKQGGGVYDDLLSASQTHVAPPTLEPGNKLSVLAGGSAALFIPFKGGEGLANTHAGLGDTIRQAGANSKFDALVGGKAMRRKRTNKSKKRKSKARKSKKSRKSKRRN